MGIKSLLSFFLLGIQISLVSLRHISNISSFINCTILHLTNLFLWDSIYWRDCMFINILHISSSFIWTSSFYLNIFFNCFIYLAFHIIHTFVFEGTETIRHFPLSSLNLFRGYFLCTSTIIILLYTVNFPVSKNHFGTF